MATLVGMQADFAKAISELIELDYDAVEAYELAIQRLKSISYKNKIEEFKKDHERHINELNEILVIHNKVKVKGPSSKQWLTKGKVVLSNLVGNDITILKAMLTNEEDTNTAYERVNNHQEKWNDAITVLKQGLLDEKRHKKWIEDTIESDIS